MSITKSIILNVDSYKVAMDKMYPPGTESVYSYIEARGGIYDETLFFGLQAFIKEYLTVPLTKADVDYAEKIWNIHGEPFDRTMWDSIVNDLGGKLPIVIRGVKEGCVIPTKNVLVTVENTGGTMYRGLTTWVETALLRAIWYPTTVATTALMIKRLIGSYLDKSGDISGLPFKLHNFGSRGCSSRETASIGGAAHLIPFLGTDTIEGVLFASEYYGADVSGFSIPAAEHSVITSWTRDGEIDAYRNMIKQFGKPGAIVAVVSDSYDIFAACEMWGTVLKEDVVASGATVVIRPDSGDPVVVLPKMMAILEKHYGAPKNTKGYKVLNNVRVIWGDGINYQSIDSILRVMVDLHGYSADNFAFGMGGALLGAPQRDDLGWAMKCSSIGVREQFELSFQKDERLVWRDVFKDPATDPGKASKKGRVQLWKCGSEFETAIHRPERWVDDGIRWANAMETYFEDGEVKFTQTFEEVRANSNK